MQILLKAAARLGFSRFVNLPDANPSYVLSVKRGAGHLSAAWELPSKPQSEVISAFGYLVDESGLLHVAARNDKRPDLQSSYSWAHNK